MSAPGRFDAIIVGGGFYGCCVALHLKEVHGLQDVLIVEREDDILKRASLVNQARIHNGYHYPRNFTTAYRSRINLPLFVDRFRGSVNDRFVMLYAIARNGSGTSARQFLSFCGEIGARAEPARAGHARLFDERQIEAVFEVDEFAFDALELRRALGEELRRSGIRLSTSSTALALDRDGRTGLRLRVRGGPSDPNGGPDGAATETVLRSQLVFNCTYAGLRRLSGGGSRPRQPLKYEIAEMVLIEPPASLRNVGVTVMDGPFFSTMPFPARRLHSLTHVAYTPHFSWTDEDGAERDAYAVLERYRSASRATLMIADAQRYLPDIRSAKVGGSLFEIKVVPAASEHDDGRPILVEPYPGLPGAYSILGSKLDNVFDVLEAIDGRLLSRLPGARPG